MNVGIRDVTMRVARESPSLQAADSRRLHNSVMMFDNGRTGSMVAHQQEPVRRNAHAGALGHFLRLQAGRFAENAFGDAILPISCSNPRVDVLTSFSERLKPSARLRPIAFMFECSPF